MHNGEDEDEDLIFYEASHSKPGSALYLSRFIAHGGRSIVWGGKRSLPVVRDAAAQPRIVASCSYLEDGLSLGLGKKMMAVSFVGSISLCVLNRHRHAEYWQSRKTVSLWQGDSEWKAVEYKERKCRRIGIRCFAVGRDSIST